MNSTISRIACISRQIDKLKTHHVRTLVSQAFQCQEAWATRLAAPVFQKIRLGEYFVELDRKFSAEQRGSALDVDIFAQAASTPSECEQLEELLFKLRRTPHTAHSPLSTGHATVRALLAANEHEEGGEQIHHLIKMLDDRINYGLFLDEYTTVLLLDKMLEDSRLVEGARIASHIMLQEENSNGLAASMGNLACWRYCATDRSESWFAADEIQVDDNPDEVIRVRVRGMVPNNYFDDHFDLREPNHILGKTLWYLNSKNDDDVSKSLCALGLALWGKAEQIQSLGKFSMIKDIGNKILDVVKDERIASFIESLKQKEMNVDEFLLNICEEAVQSHEKDIIQEQLRLYQEWNDYRETTLEKEYRNLVRKSRKEAIQHAKEDLAREEEKLFFFENFDRLEQEKEEKDQAWRKTFPSRSWNQKNFFRKGKYVPKPGQERKEARWERREAKRGPPK